MSDPTNPLTMCILKETLPDASRVVMHLTGSSTLLVGFASRRGGQSPEIVHQADGFRTLAGRHADLGPARVEVWGRCIRGRDASG
jgi:hypothetical protein